MASPPITKVPGVSRPASTQELYYIQRASDERIAHTALPVESRVKSTHVGHFCFLGDREIAIARLPGGVACDIYQQRREAQPSRM